MAVITGELEAERKVIREAAQRLGLDCFDTIFELVSYKQLNEVAAKGGFPVRYPHWRFGMEFEGLSKSYEYGLSKIYELVINNDPCYAYLMEGNDFVDQKLVMAHVYGHCDFFKNNKWFSLTNRKMMDTMANHAVRIRRLMEEKGQDLVEDFVDRCLSIENLIDVYKPYRVDTAKKNNVKVPEATLSPAKPDRDVIQFLLDFAPIENWQVEVLEIIRNEAYYFAPQGMTKIMNEGWASYWHSKILTEEVLHDCEIVDFADRHSGAMVMPPSGFNPYKIGIELFRDIERRWDRGQFGRDWESADDLGAKQAWNTKAGQGREKIFQVRRDYNDVMFIDEFLTEDFCREHKLFVYRYNKRTNQFEVDNRDFGLIKKKFLFQITNLGQPIISVAEGNFRGKGELLLTHLYEGVDLQPGYMQATMENIHALWRKPVNLATVMDGEGRIFVYDGHEFRHEAYDKIDVPVDQDSSSDSKDSESS
jgi:stage V sporulation protein R